MQVGYDIGMSAHTYTTRVYYADTDAGGVMYYGTYLRLLEAARCEVLMDAGFDLFEHHARELFFMVARVDIRYRKPARLGDRVTVSTVLAEIKGASLIMRQTVMRGGEALVEADVTLAHADASGKPRRLPDGLKDTLARFSG